MLVALVVYQTHTVLLCVWDRLEFRAPRATDQIRLHLATPDAMLVKIISGFPEKYLDFAAGSTRTARGG
jgi:hypothetical protein